MENEKKEGEAEEVFEIIETPEPGETAAKAPVEDERLRSSDEDEDDDEHAADGETPEQRAERRRDERRKRKERQKRAERESKALIEELKMRNDSMASRMAQLEAHALTKEAEGIDQRLFNSKRRYEYAERAHEEAIARGDGIGATKALRARDEAAQEFNDAQHVRARLTEMQQPERQPQRQQGPDPRVKEMAREFINKHSWIDPKGEKDDDSAIAQTVDIRLQKEGYDPRTEEYWEKLEERLKERLPHRFKAEPPGRKGPPVAGGSDRVSSGKKQFFLSAERKKAMQDAGMWEDEATRNRVIKGYADHDAQYANKATR